MTSTAKSPSSKKPNKRARELKVLIGLIEYYLQTGKPVGSNTLKEAGFGDLSSATIRNYFSQLEADGYLHQLHSSGGRIPSEKAYKLYAKEMIDHPQAAPVQITRLDKLRTFETREVSPLLQKCAEELSLVTHSAVFLTAPRFDHDFVVGIKVLAIDAFRCLCALITNFGIIRTEVLHSDTKLNAFTVKRFERYFYWRLTGHDKPEDLKQEEEEFIQNAYNEMMMRYVVGYSHFVEEEVYRTGFARLLNNPDFGNPIIVANALGLFEHTQSLKHLLRECITHNRLKTWIGSDLAPYITPSQPGTPCSVVAIPYHIQRKPVGAIGLLNSTRLPYREVFGLLQQISGIMNELLTRNLYKFKLSYREPHAGPRYLEKEKQRLLGDSRLILLEDQSQ